MKLSEGWPTNYKPRCRARIQTPTRFIIFAWRYLNGVVLSRGPSSKWLRENCRDKSLHSQIRTAVKLLATAASEAELTPFDGSNLVMNSGLTKVYALASPSNVIIYDGRIGAAIGLFARYIENSYPTEPTFPCGRKLLAVPPVLQFPWGDGLAAEGSRDPSIGEYKFPPLRSGANFAHACACWKASKVLRLA